MGVDRYIILILGLLFLTHKFFAVLLTFHRFSHLILDIICKNVSFSCIIVANIKIQCDTILIVFVRKEHDLGSNVLLTKQNGSKIKMFEN